MTERIRSAVKRELEVFPAAKSYIEYQRADDEAHLMLVPSVLFGFAIPAVFCCSGFRNQDLPSTLTYVGSLAVMTLVSTPLVFESAKNFKARDKAALDIAEYNHTSESDLHIEKRKIENVLSIASYILPGSSGFDDYPRQLIDKLVYPSSPTDYVKKDIDKDIDKGISYAKKATRGQAENSIPEALSNYRLAMTIAICAWGSEILNGNLETYREYKAYAMVDRALSERHRAHPLAGITPDNL